MSTPYTGVKVYTKEELARAPAFQEGLTADDLVNLNLCNNFLLLRLAEYFRIPGQVALTGMSMCQRYWVYSTSKINRFNVVVGCFHLSLKQHSYSIKLSEVATVALTLEYGDEVNSYLGDRFKDTVKSIEDAQLEVMKANEYNSNTSALLSVRVLAMQMVFRKKLTGQEGQNVVNRCNEYLTYTYGCEIVLTLSANHLAIVIMCMVFRLVLNRGFPENQGVPIWSYAGIGKKYFIQIVKEIVDFWGKNWIMQSNIKVDHSRLQQLFDDAEAVREYHSMDNDQSGQELFGQEQLIEDEDISRRYDQENGINGVLNGVQSKDKQPTQQQPALESREKQADLVQDKSVTPKEEGELPM